LNHAILRDVYRQKLLPSVRKEDQEENIEVFKVNSISCHIHKQNFIVFFTYILIVKHAHMKEKYYPGDRVVVLKRSKKDERDMHYMPDAIVIHGDIEMTSKKKAKQQSKQDEMKARAKERENAHKKKVGQHQSPYGLHAHGIWSIEELKEGARDVPRTKTGVVTRCADHINRYIIEFDDKVSTFIQSFDHHNSFVQ
jgi:hypothetical protein